MMNTLKVRILTVGLAASLVGLVAASPEDEVQNVQAGELTFKAPSAWKSEKPSSPMRKGQIKIKPAAGDDEGAELVITSFPGAVGGIEANVKRWEGGFQEADKSTAKAKVEKRKGLNVEVTRVEVAGRYVAAMMPGQPGKNDKPNYRLLGAIVPTAESTYFFKLTGPDRTVREATKGFDAMIESMTLEK